MTDKERLAFWFFEGIKSGLSASAAEEEAKAMLRAIKKYDAKRQEHNPK